MAIPPNVELRLRFTAQGLLTLGDRRHLRCIANQEIVLEVLLQKLDDSNVPPVFNPIDITGWSARWIAKIDIDDITTPIWDIGGVIVGALPLNGRFSFTVPKADTAVPMQFGYSELVFFSSGTTDPDTRVPLAISLSKAVLSI